MKSIKLTINAIYLVIALSVGASLALAETSVTFCAQDARVCSNGAIVSRNPNNACVFDACPETPTSSPATSTKPRYLAPVVTSSPFCSMEAKLCPDGRTSVGRTGANCEFAACPSTTASTSNMFCTMDAMLCGDGSSVGRDPNNGCAFKACPAIVTTPKPTSTIFACTMDAKVCPNGAIVGRTGANCDFAACPVTTDTPKKGDYDSSCTTSIDLSNNMRIRSADNNFNGEVTKLQKFLYEKKLLAISPTGYFGSMTKAAVVKFQLSAGLDGTGYVGPYTRAAIKAINICDDENVSDTAY